MNDYISSIDTAKNWGISRRRVTALCTGGRVPGAIVVGDIWLIPAKTKKPADARIKSGKYVKSPEKEGEV